MIIDGGNAHFADTRRREARAARARPPLRRHGRLRRRGGRAERPEHHAGRLAGVVRGARPDAGGHRRQGRTATPCCTHVGPDGAGHFVKMVHNGIEYADMQLIAEAYDLLRARRRHAARRDRRGLPHLEPGPAGLVPDRDHRRGARPHRRRDRASRSSTSCSTRPSRRAPAAGPCRPRSTSACRSSGIAEAVFARSLSGHAALREAARRPARAGAALDGADARPSPTTSSRRCTRRRSSRTRRASTRSRPAAPSTAGTSTSARWRRSGGAAASSGPRFLDRIRAAYDGRPATCRPC